MAKTKISEFSSTPGNNTDIDGINIAEGCAPSGINNAIRELMSQLKDFQAGTAGDSFNGPVGTSTAAAGAFTTLSASSTVSGVGFSNYLASPPAIGGTTAAAGSFTTLTTSGAVTHNAGTANGVAYLNGSKVLTTGSALTFDGTNLGVGTASPTGTTNYSALVLNGTTGGWLRFWSGGTPVGSIFANSTDGLNVETVTATPVIFKVNGSEQMRLTSTGLGIGTSSPGEKLTVVGAGRFNASGEALTVGANALAANTAQYFRNTSGYGVLALASASDQYLTGVVAGDFVIGSNARSLRFGNAGTGALGATLDSSGNLGLGVTPSAWEVAAGRKAIEVGSVGNGLYGYSVSNFNMSSNAYFNSGWKYASSGSAASYYNQSGGAHSWFTAPSGTAGNAISFTQAMTLDASGSLLVGTTSSLGSNYLVQMAGGRASFAGNSDSLGLYLRYNTSTAGFFIGSPSANTLAFADSNGTERARIDSSGNLLVGTTNNNIGGTTTVGINATSTGVLRAGCDGGAALLLNRISSDGTTAFFQRQGTTVGTISVTGSATAYNTSSDYRLKENIQPMAGALAKVSALKPCTYKWKVDGSDGEGFIAHELAEVVPQCVTGEKDAVDAEGNPQYQGIDTSFLVATLTAAIQEQQAIINQLKARLDAANL